MKKILFAAFVVICLDVLSLKAQNTHNDGPKDVAHQWLTDFYHQDYSAALKLSTDETRNLLNTLDALSPAISDSAKQQSKQIIITIKSTKIDGERATVIFSASDSPTKNDELHLIKQGEKWLVQFTKDDMGG